MQAVLWGLFPSIYYIFLQTITLNFAMNLKPRETVNWFGQKLWPWPLSLSPLYTVLSGLLGLGEGPALLAGEDSPVHSVPWSFLIQDVPLLHWGCHHTGPCPCVWEGESGCLSPFPGGWLRFAYGPWWNGAAQEGGPRPTACTFLGDPGPSSPLDYSWWERSWGRCSGCHFCKSHIVLTRHDIFDIEVKHCSWSCVPLKS